MPKPWKRSQEQEAYLDALIPKLVKARRDHRIERFKDELYEGWFSHWPEELVVFGKDWEKGPMTLEDMRRLGAAIEKRKMQLYNYVRWHGNGKVIRSRSSGVLKKFVNMNRKTHKRPRKNQKLELYSQRYYKTRFKAQVDQEILETAPSDESKMAYRKRKMAIYQKWRSLAWQMESDEVKAEIEALWIDANSASDVLGDDDDAEDEPDSNKTEHSKSRGYGGQLDELGELLTSFLRELQEETGWAFTIFGGGLNHQGDVKVVTSHVGKTAAGATFPQMCNNYQDNVLQEFLAFIKILHPIEERLLCAQVNNEQNSPPSPNKAMSQANVADKSYETTDQTSGVAAVDASEGDNYAKHEKVCNSMDVDITSNGTDGAGATLASSLSSLSLSTPANINFAHPTSADAAILSHVNAVPDFFPSGDFQPASFSHCTATSTLSLEHSTAAPMASTELAPDLNWTYHGSSPSFSMPVMPAAPYGGLSPMWVMTASNDAAACNSIVSTDSQPSSLILFNSTNMANPASTTSTWISDPFNPALYIDGVNPQLSHPTSFIRGSGLVSGIPGPAIPIAEPVPNRVTETCAQSVNPPNEPENRAPGTNAKSGNINQALAKARRRSRKDELDMTYVLPEGATRAHKPRQMADETHWEGTAPKRPRNRRS